MADPMNLDSLACVGNEHMRPLVIDEQAKRLVRRVRDFAEHPENVYQPERGGPVPGDDPKHVIHLNTYRCVYSITEFKGKKFRHFSVSVPGRKWPNVAAILADLFGFVGWDQETIDRFPPGWLAQMDTHVQAIVLAQEI
jgi:hypothetical protein